MNEREWLVSIWPGPMLRHLTHEVHRAPDAVGDYLRDRPLASERKLRLYACAIFRSQWLHLAPTAVEALDKLELGAEGCIPWEEASSGWGHYQPAAEFAKSAVDWARAHHGQPTTFQAALLRCIVGNPFSLRQTSLMFVPPVWNAPDVARLDAFAVARSAYEDRRPDGSLDASRLCVLADALLDADCNEELLLSHLRLPGRHARGCWAVDAVLGKS